MVCAQCGGDRFTRLARYSAPVSGYLLGGEWPLACAACGHIEKPLDPRRRDG